jgi:hypothetical protein
MTDTSTDKVNKAIGMVRAHGLHGTEVTLRALAAERDGLRAALSDIERQFGSTPGGHMAATIARAALNANIKR